MQLRHLTTFSAVAEQLSFTRAAAQLGYVQSAVTSHVKALEDELGVRLFDRLGRRVVLTEAGSRLLDYADRIVRLCEEATTVVGQSDEAAGPVTVSAPEVLCTYRLPAVIRRLYEQHPRVQLLFRANPTGALDSDLRRALANGEVDVAYVLEEDIAGTDALQVEPLATEPLLVVASPDHPLARAASVRPLDLEGVPVLLTDKGCGYRRVFERALHRESARVAIAGEFTSGETVKRCVEAGTAIGVLAAISVETELRSGRLTKLPWSGPALTLTSYLVSHRQRWISPAHAALRDATHDSFSRESPEALPSVA